MNSKELKYSTRGIISAPLLVERTEKITKRRPMRSGEL